MHERAFNFRTQYDRVRIESNSGDREHILRSPQFDREGRMSLVETGKEDLYAFIQSHKDSVDVGLILKRFAQGDVTALSRTQGMYGDFTQMPKTYAEMLNSINRAEEYFLSLPVETRAKFNHSVNEFIASIGSSEFAEKLGLPVVAPEAVPIDPKDGEPVVE